MDGQLDNNNNNNNNNPTCASWKRAHGMYSYASTHASKHYHNMLLLRPRVLTNPPLNTQLKNATMQGASLSQRTLVRSRPFDRCSLTAGSHCTPSAPTSPCKCTRQEGSVLLTLLHATFFDTCQPVHPRPRTPSTKITTINHAPSVPYRLLPRAMLRRLAWLCTQHPG
jgi:hypothetical protein